LVPTKEGGTLTLRHVKKRNTSREFFESSDKCVRSI